MPHNPEDYWRSYETQDPVVDLEGLLRFVEAVADQSHQVVWRGVADEGWPLHSCLYRRALRSSSPPPTERQLQRTERKVLEAAREWGVDRLPSGLTNLELLAKLQQPHVTPDQRSES